MWTSASICGFTGWCPPSYVCWFINPIDIHWPVRDTVSRINHPHMRTMVLVYLPSQNWVISKTETVGKYMIIYVNIPAPWFAYGIYRYSHILLVSWGYYSQYMITISQWEGFQPLIYQATDLSNLWQSGSGKSSPHMSSILWQLGALKKTSHFQGRQKKTRAGLVNELTCWPWK